MTVTTPTTDVRALYTARAGSVTVIDVPELLFASVEGSGAPSAGGFQRAVPLLYTLAYGVRFAARARGVDERVSPLEALWWSAHPERDFMDALARGGYTAAEQESWSWRAMIRLPWAAEGELAATVRADAARRHPELRDGLETVRIDRWREGLCVQTLHVGPYAAEPATVKLMHEHIDARGYQAAGHHHEIYLGDPRRSAPEKLRTILRQPITTAS